MTVFFVISGYLMGQLLDRDTVDFARFYQRRALRIVPASVVCVVVTLVVMVCSMRVPGMRAQRERERERERARERER